MKEIIEEFTASLMEEQNQYDRLLTNARVCLSNRIGECSCKRENPCLNCKQDAVLFDEITALQQKGKVE